MRSTFRCAALVLGLAAGGLSASPGDWPQFHGPNRDNISHESGLLKEWPAAGPTLAWRAQGIGAGYSSVSVVDGKVFTAGDKTDGNSYVFALNEKDGTLLWKAKLGKVGGNYAGTRATPTVDGELLYMLGQFGDLVCYKVADGSEVWRKNLNKDLSGKMMSGWGNAESVVIEGDKVICTPGGTEGALIALDKKTGAQVWRATAFTDKAAYTAPVIAEIGGVRQAVVLTADHVAGIAVADGKLLWSIDRHGETAVIPTPIVKDNYVYVTSGYKIGCDLFKVNGSLGDNKFSAEKVYTNNKVMVNHHGGVIQLDGLIYGYSDTGGWTCQDMLTGQAKWEDKKIAHKGTISFADGRFYLRDQDSGDVVLLDAGGDHHVEKGRFHQPDRSKLNAWPHLVISNGQLYVRDQDNLFVYDIKAK